MQTERIIALISTIRDKANKFIFQQLRSHGIEDIAPAHGGIFVHLFRHSELTMGEMARFIERDKSTVTTLVEKLVTLGYLQKEKDSNDGRITKIRLTKQGKTLEKDFKKISQTLQERAYTGFSQKEKENLIDLLTRVDNNF